MTGVLVQAWPAWRYNGSQYRRPNEEFDACEVMLHTLKMFKSRFDELEMLTGAISKVPEKEV